jgi:type IV secretion system protein VirB9
MKQAILSLLACTALSTPTWALVEPKGSKDDSHVCTASYSPGQVIHLHGKYGQTTTIEFSSPGEQIKSVAVDDTAHLKRSMAANVVWLKPTIEETDPSPLTVLTYNTKDETKTKVYVFQWDAGSSGGRIASNSQIAPASDPCYIVRVNDPNWNYEERAAAWRAQQAVIAQQRAEAALKENRPARINKHYVARGNLRPVPRVWDDGNTTFVKFEGNERIPTVYVVNPDGKEAVTGYSVEGHTIQIHQVARSIRLRDADTILCVFNQAYDPVGTPTGTGTTSTSVIRDVRSSGLP